MFRSFKSYASGELVKHEEQDKAGMGYTLYIGSLKSEVYFCVYEKSYEQYIKLGIPIEEAPIKNRFEIRLKNERAYYAVRDLLTYYDAEGKDSVDLIRDSLFSIQVEKPWLLLQFGNSDTEEIGIDRVEALVSASPSDEDGETRENVVKTEIEDNDNDNLTIPQVVNRLGMVFFLLIFNLGITIFIFLLTGMMLFSQILFIIYAMFLPVSFLQEADVSVSSDTVKDATAFLETFFKLYPTATEKELAYYVKDGVIAPVSGDYVFSELVNPVFTKDGDNLKVSVSVKYLDNKSKMTQISQYELVLHKDDNWKIVE